MKIFLFFGVVSLVSFLPAISQAKSYPSHEQQIQTARLSIIGITKFTGAHFQSCAPLLNPDENSTDVLKYFWGDDPDVVQNRCKDRREADFRYISFGKGSYDTWAGRVQFRNENLDSFDRFHCSGYAGATLAASGFKYYQAQPSWLNLTKDPNIVATDESSAYVAPGEPRLDTGYFNLSPDTGDIHKIFKRRDSCFFRPWLKKSRSILPGDYLNTSYAHVVKVFTIGDDPLGLKKVKRRSDCQNIKKENFDFTIAHSSSRDKDGGISGVKIESAAKTSTRIISRLAKYTRELCYETYNNGTIGGRIKDIKVGRKKVFIRYHDQFFSLRRHYGHFKKECVMDPKPNVWGQSCLDGSCYQKVLNQSAW